jgi:hypothetical protein
MKLPKIPLNFFGAFVRGYFDGDGNVWSGFLGGCFGAWDEDVVGW